MPSDYTHFYFGHKAIDYLPETLAVAVREHLQFFDIGLQGPDILFFYEPLHKCPVNQLGFSMHGASAKDFFYPARTILNTFSGDEKSSALAYLAGFLCHYTLDVTCHGYIEKKLTVSGLTHSQLEKEFDRYLMVKENGAVSKVKTSTNIIPSKKNAAVISAFFPNVTAKDIQKTLKSMVFITNLLSGRGLRRPFVTAGLKISGQYRKLFDMLIPKDTPVGSEDSNLRLEKLLEKALGTYSEYALEYEAFLNGGDFPDDLAATFGAGENWEQIPILTLEEEKLYEV